MHLISLNVSLPRDVDYNGTVVSTGIFKTPVTGRHKVTQTNIDGDGQGDLKAHGGVDKAVYAYPHEHYSLWSDELGRSDLTPGQFGENLTTAGLLESDVYIGDVFRIGTAVLQVCQPRIPCYKLGIRMGREDFPRLFLQSQRSGFYLRVLEEGDIGVGDRIEVVTRVKRDNTAMSVLAINELVNFDRENFTAVEQALSVPALAESIKRVLRRRLARSLPEDR